MGSELLKRAVINSEVSFDSSGLIKHLVHVFVHGFLEHSVHFHILLGQEHTQLIQELVAQVLIQDFKSLVFDLLTFIALTGFKQLSDVVFSDLALLNGFFFLGLNFQRDKLFFLVVLELVLASVFKLGAAGLKLSFLGLLLLFEHQS